MAFNALVAGGLVVEVGPVQFPVVADWTWVDVSSLAPAPAHGWTATCTGGVWSFAAPAVPAFDAQAALAAGAQSALDRSDVTIIRCYEHAVAVPAEWAAYRASLRSIVSGASTPSALPAAPAFPAGT